MTETAFLKEVCVDAEKAYWQKVFDKIDSQADVEIPEETDRRILGFIDTLEKKDLNLGAPIVHSKRKEKRWLKILLAAAIICSLMTVSAFSSAPFKAFMSKIYERGKESGTAFHFDITRERDYFKEEFTYIPEGYVKVKEIYWKKSKSHEVYCSNGIERIIIISNKNTSGFGAYIDTENAETGEIKVGNYDGFYSITKRSIILVWSTGEYNHRISADLNGDLITLDEVMKIAESRVPKKWFNQ